MYGETDFRKGTTPAERRAALADAAQPLAKQPATDAGFKATEEFVAAAGAVRGLIADGRVARSDVQQVRVAARRALGEAARALGADTVADAAKDREDLWRQHTNVAIGHLRAELKRLRDEANAATVTTKPVSERLMDEALAIARIEQAINLAALLLPMDDLHRLVDSLNLRAYYNAL